MPLVTARLSAEPSREFTAQVVEALTSLTVELLHKERERVTVVVDYVPGGRWARGGLPAHGFYVEVKVTAGTNSAEQKARYVRQVNQALQALLRGSPGYVIVDEIAADAWGYAGVTQQVRYTAKALA